MKHTLSVLIPAAILLAPPAADAPSAKPNIVFIFSDDHAVQAIGAYGARLYSSRQRYSVCSLTP